MNYFLLYYKEMTRNFTNTNTNMIDTVTLLLPRGKYEIQSPDDFKPSFEPFDYGDEQQINEFLRVHKGSLRYKRNPDIRFRKHGEVYPNLAVDEPYFLTNKCY